MERKNIGHFRNAPALYELSKRLSKHQRVQKSTCPKKFGGRNRGNPGKCEQILFPFLNKKREAINKQQKTIDKEQKKNTSEIITALDAYFDKLSLDDQKEPDIDLVIPNLPIAIIATQEKEEIVVDVKKK